MTPRRSLLSVLLALPLASLAVVATASVAGDPWSDAVSSICGAEQRLAKTDGPKRLTIQDGMGVGGFVIRTANPEAQAWFDYGIKLFHDFYHDDARLAFDKAVAADPDCAMCLWGRALSRGPTQNFDVPEAQLKEALGYAQAAQAKAQGDLEKRLAAAMVARDSAKQDAAAEDDFADALLTLADNRPGALDLKLIASEALLTAWRRDDKHAAKKAVVILEQVLKEAPDNTAAIHYYIHATEFAGTPALALPYASQLATLAPRASHLVHMASHTFMRVGEYEAAAAINATALKVDADHLIDTNTPGPLGDAFYYGHNLRFGMAGSLLSGDAALGLKFADHLHRAFPESAFVREGLNAADGQRFVIYARFAPDRLASMSEPGADRPVARAMYHYARGEAFAAGRDLDGLNHEAAQISADRPLLKIAVAVLAGRAAMLQGRYDAAIDRFGNAATLEAANFAGSMDPPPWWYPVRRSLAAANLEAGKPRRAIKEASQALKAWPEDPLTLLVLGKAEEQTGETALAHDHLAQAVKGWHGDLSKVSLETL